MTEKFSLEERVDYLKEHGSHCMAYSTLQPGMRYFDLNGVGYLGYMEKWGTRVVLGDPVSGKNNYEKIIGEALKEHKDTCFVQTTKDCAEVLKDFGFYINGFGVENILDLNNFKVSWNTRKDLKRWISSVPKQGVYFLEDKDNLFRDELSFVSDKWKKTKLVKKELAFLARPFLLNKEFDVRRFCSFDKDHNLVGFCSFDPQYSSGNIFSYSLNHIRSLPNSINGIVDYTILSSLQEFKLENVPQVNLGLSPLHEMDHNSFRGSFITSLFENFLYSHSDKIYSFKNLGFHKDRYLADKKQTYLSFPSKFSLPSLLKLMKVNNII